jgi:hypothetical protein
MIKQAGAQVVFSTIKRSSTCHVVCVWELAPATPVVALVACARDDKRMTGIEPRPYHDLMAVSQ